MDVDTTLGGWPGHSSSSAEPRQALGARVWRWEDSLRTDVLEALLSVQPTQDSCSPHRPCCATKPTHSASKALQLNRARERLQRHLLYQPWEAWGNPRGGERVPPATRNLVGPAGFSSAVPLRCCPHRSYCPCAACPGHGDSPRRRPGPSAGWALPWWPPPSWRKAWVSEEAILSPRKLVAGAGLPLCCAPQAGASRGQLCRRLAGGGVPRAGTSSLCSRQWGQAVSLGRGSSIRDDLRDWGQVTRASQGRALKTMRAPGSRLAAGDSLGQMAWGC